MIVEVLSVASLVAPQPSPAQGAATETAFLELRVEPFVDRWYHVRWFAEQRQRGLDLGAAAGPKLHAAADAVQVLAEPFGPPSSWGIVEGHLGHAVSADELRSAFATLPEQRTFRGADVALREGALAIVDALVAYEADYEKQVARRHRAHIDRGYQGLSTDLVPHLDACFGSFREHLDLERGPDPVPVLLVYRATWPGAVTHRSGPGTGVCIVSVRDFVETELRETVLHESLHALDIANDTDVFDALRELLEQEGASPRSALGRTLPHALMFVHAAETMRRHVDPEHVDYGLTTGLYERLGEPAEVVREVWPRYLDGEIDRPAALEALAVVARQAVADDAEHR